MPAATDDSRCPWCQGSQLYRDYHDTEWGVPCFDAVALFELLNLEGAQAGLSWITILNKRDNYRRLFAGFDPVKVSRFTDKRIDKLLLDPGIVRHRQKITSVVGNARAMLAMQANGEDFAAFLWSFVDYRPRQNHPQALAEVPARTDASERMSKALKKRGFRFVGATTCYAFMQAAGMVNDHLVSCPAHARCAALAEEHPPPADWPSPQ